MQAKARQSFRRLTKRLWDDRGISLSNKVDMYNAAILTSLLYGAEFWVLYRRHVRKLEQFHMWCGEEPEHRSTTKHGDTFRLLI